MARAQHVSRCHAAKKEEGGADAGALREFPDAVAAAATRAAAKCRCKSLYTVATKCRQGAALPAASALAAAGSRPQSPEEVHEHLAGANAERCASRRSPSRRIQPEGWQDDRLAAHHCHCGITVARQLTPRPHCPGGREGVASFCAFKGMSSTPRHATTQTIPARGGPYHHSSAVGWLASRAGLLKAAGASWNWPGEGDDISSCEALCWRSVMSSCNNIIYRKVCARHPLKSTRGHPCPGPFARARGNQCPD